MEIRKTRIINLENYLGAIPDGRSFRIITNVTERPEQLARAGFGPVLGGGETVLPTPHGRVSRYNADGRWTVRRDLPKELRYIRTISWRWRQWAGRDQHEEKEEFRDIYRDCYPRELVPPPSVEVTYVEVEELRLIASPVLTRTAQRGEANKHAINLFLELFGVCELVTEDLARYSRLDLRTVNWRMLPPGEYPWEQLRTHLEQMLDRTSENTQRVILDRAAFLRSLNPDQVFVGAGGFGDYVAYLFRVRGIVVLESIRRDNALYVFGDDWQTVSRLTKAEVLSQRRQQARIIHTDGWKDRLQAVVNRSAAA